MHSDGILFAETTFQNDRVIIGRCARLKLILDQIATVAPTDSTVLLHGETGTGKEILAHTIHDLSTRKLYRFVKVNCAAIPSGLLESELFGHDKGAFTGALTQRIGRFETAHKGTILLDEIGDIPLDVQPKLLRVLQEHEFERLGSCTTISSDVRILAATHRDLDQMVKDGKFRADLFYRLSVFPIAVPPLRERLSDIPLLVRHFVDVFSRRMNKTVNVIPVDALRTLTSYDWPGNVRELQNVIERAVILATRGVLCLPLDAFKKSPKNLRVDLPVNGTLKDLEHAFILQVLKDKNWVIGGENGAARRLGLPRTTLISRMRKLGITRQPNGFGEEASEPL